MKKIAVIKKMSGKIPKIKHISMKEDRKRKKTEKWYMSWNAEETQKLIYLV